MNPTTARRMIAAEILKLRRHRGTMTIALALSVGITILYFAVIVLRHGGGLDGNRLLGNGTSLMGIYFGSFAAILIGAQAGTTDLTSGVFRDLVATGRARLALFGVRVPAAIAVALACTLGGFLVTLLAALVLGTSAPGLGLILQSVGWVVLATVVQTALAVGVASFTGSRALTLTLVLGWQTIATGLLYGAHFLGSARNAVLMIALTDLRPGPAIGTRGQPGSSNALPGYELEMAAAVAIVVVLAWTIVPLMAGAWRTATQDA